MLAILTVSPFFCVIVAILAQQASATHIKMCVEMTPEQRKCEKMAEKVKSFVELECELNSPCEEIIAEDKADFAVVYSNKYTIAVNKLEPVFFEKFDDDNVIVAVVEAGNESMVDELPLYFNERDMRELHSALYLNHYRHKGICKNVKPADGVTNAIEIIRYTELKDKTNKKLVCVENDKIVVKSVDDYKTCHVEANIPNAVMVKKDSDKKEIVEKMMTELSEKHYDDFKLFGVFANKFYDLIFSNEATKFVKEYSAPNGVTVEKFLDLHCGNVTKYFSNQAVRE